MVTAFDVEAFIDATRKEYNDRQAFGIELRSVLSAELVEALNIEIIYNGEKAKGHLTYRHRTLTIEQTDGLYSIHVGGMPNFDRRAIASDDLKSKLGLALGDIRDESTK